MPPPLLLPWVFQICSFPLLFSPPPPILVPPPSLPVPNSDFWIYFLSSELRLFMLHLPCDFHLRWQSWHVRTAGSVFEALWVVFLGEDVYNLFPLFYLPHFIMLLQFAYFGDYWVFELNILFNLSSVISTWHASTWILSWWMLLCGVSESLYSFMYLIRTKWD